MSMFETKNSNGQGGYFAGFTPDTGPSTQDDDNPNFDFGDKREASFLAAFNYLTKGSFFSDAGPATISATRIKSEILNSNGISFDQGFKGMIQSPHNLKLKGSRR